MKKKQTLRFNKFRKKSKSWSCFERLPSIRADKVLSEHHAFDVLFASVRQASNVSARSTGLNESGVVFNKNVLHEVEEGLRNKAILRSNHEDARFFVQKNF